MAVQQVQLVLTHHLVHPHRQREIVWRELEQRVAADVYLVEEHTRQKRRQSEGLLIRHEVHFVTARGERDTELRRHGA